jgi:hypothetical protein
MLSKTTTITPEQLKRIRDYLNDDCQMHLKSHGKWTLDSGKLMTALECAGVSVRQEEDLKG